MAWRFCSGAETFSTAVPLVTLDHISVAFGHLPLLDDASLTIDPKERIAILGRNGTGKTTLLQILSGEVAPDTGSVWRQPGLKVARLEQDVPLSANRPVSEVVAEGLVGLLGHDAEEWRRAHHVDLIYRASSCRRTRSSTPCRATGAAASCWHALVANRTCCCSTSPPITRHRRDRVARGISPRLSGHWSSRDRAFLQRLATRIIEIDRANLTSWPGDYVAFVEKKDAALAAEATQQEKFDKRLAQEETWLRRGVKARRTRDEGRVRALMAMRAERAARRELTGTCGCASIAPIRRGGWCSGDEVQRPMAIASGRAIFDAHHAWRSGRPDRPEQRGQTTVLRILLGELEPDEGSVRRGANVLTAYYDQQREQLDPERTVFDTIGEGNDTVTVNGQTRHVNGYLRDFLFPAERARSPVKALSGGERNRLLLARLLTKPANVLVLDEPTIWISRRSNCSRRNWWVARDARWSAGRVFWTTS